MSNGVMHKKGLFIEYKAYFAAILLSAVLFCLLEYCCQLNRIIAYLLSINAATFLLFGYDKLIAGSSLMRVPERTLYILSILGASPAVLVGINLFRHKTRKPAFQVRIILIFLIQLALFYVIWS